MVTQFFFRDGSAVPEKARSLVVVGKRGYSGSLTWDEPCPRCGGAGGSTCWRPDGGVCYQCRGCCTIPVTHRVFTAEKLAMLVEAAEKRAEKKHRAAVREAEKKRQEFIAWAKPHGKLIGGILMAKRGSFLASLGLQLMRRCILTDKQLAAAADAIEREAEREAQDAASGYVGEVKERIEFEALVVGVYDSEGFYGHTDIVRLRDLDDNLLTWFASGYAGLERGDRVSIRGTVKEHQVYRGVKQTIITRCKFEKFKVVTADEAASTEVVA